VPFHRLPAALTACAVALAAAPVVADGHGARFRRAHRRPLDHGHRVPLISNDRIYRNVPGLELETCD
jgi:hypothetical protein